MSQRFGYRRLRPLWSMLIAASITAPVCTTMAQTAHRVPFASSGNVIELLLENSTQSALPELTVRLTDPPSWIRMTPEYLAVGSQLLPGKPRTIAFAFAVDKSAPVGSVEQLTFTLSSGSRERWTKSIAISVLPPERFELMQNYPNPFNPATTIGFTLPRSSQTLLKVYNLLGEEVATLAEGTFEPGYHEVVWDASTAPSGVYLYRLNTSGSVLGGRMMVLK